VTLSESILEKMIASSSRLRDTTTKGFYQRSVRGFLAFAGDNPKHWTGAAVEAWRDDLKSRGLKPETINGRIFALRFASRRYADLGHGIDFARAAETLPTSTGKTRQAIPLDVARQILATCGFRSPADLRDRALLTLALRTGMRRGGLAKLLRSDDQDGRLTVTLKGGRRHKMPPCDEETRGALTAWYAWLDGAGAARGRIFRSLHRTLEDRWTVGESLSEAGIYSIVVGRAQAAGAGHVHPHLFRHTFVSWARQNGWPDWYIAQWTGHRSVGTLVQTFPMLDTYTSAADPGVPALPSLRDR
jgi:integrase